MDSLRRIGARRGQWSGILFLAAGVSACDTEIYPIAPTEMAYSIHGYLDAMADSQWIRVAPFRTSIFSTPDLVDAEVTIEDLGTGRTIELIPTLFKQGSGNFGDTLFAYNFRTAEPIEHATTYRLSARRSDGSAASTRVGRGDAGRFPAARVRSSWVFNRPL
jgi:hypothetical protein